MKEAGNEVRQNLGAIIGKHALTYAQMTAMGALGIVCLILAITGVVRGATISCSGVAGAIIIGIMGVAFVFASIGFMLTGSRESIFFVGGVIDRRGSSVRKYLYSDLSMAYFIVRTRRRTERSLVLTPFDGSEPINVHVLTYSGSVLPAIWTKLSVEQLETVRNAAAGAIAERMTMLINSGKTIPWCRGVRLSKDGVVRASEITPWSALVEHADENRGHYTLMRKFPAGLVASVGMTDPNFIPGWRVVRTMIQQAAMSKGAAK